MKKVWMIEMETKTRSSPGTAKIRLPLEFATQQDAETFVGRWRQEYDCRQDPFWFVEVEKQ